MKLKESEKENDESFEELPEALLQTANTLIW